MSVSRIYNIGPLHIWFIVYTMISVTSVLVILNAPSSTNITNIWLHGTYVIVLVILTATSSSSYISVYVSQCHVYSRAVVFHTLQRGQRDNRLCPYLVYCTTVYPLFLTQLRESSVSMPLIYSSSPSSSASVSAVAAAVYLAPAR